MKILAFDTSSIACSVSILNTDRTAEDQIKSIHKIAHKQHAGLILPMINEILQSSSLKLTELDAIAYGCGPGSFTGTRIASSVAQGLSFAAQLPVIKISSLAAIAQSAFKERQWKKLLVAVDAKMLHVYWAIYQVNSSGYVCLMEDEKASHPEEIYFNHDEQRIKDWFGVGDGWRIYANQLKKNLGFPIHEINSLQLPTSRAILELAKIEYENKHFIKAYEALPVYLT